MNWIELCVKILFLILTAVVSAYVVPWLKEKKLYDTVYRMVQAAEKWNRTHEIDKKQWVIGLLEARGITVNAYVDALIEACVEELDIRVGTALTYEEEEE